MSRELITVVNAAILSPVSPVKCRFLPKGQLAFDHQGNIIHCGRQHSWGKKAVKLPLPPGSVIIPGLIDCHTHLSQYHVRGRTGHTLMQWLKEYVFPAEASFRDRGYARKVSGMFCQKLLSNGVTAAALYANFPQGVEEAMEAARRTGIRALVGYTLMDRNVPKELRQSPDRAINECRCLLEKALGCGCGRVEFSVNPRFAPATSPKFMERIGRFAKATGTRVQTHLSENAGEIEYVRKLFPGARNYADVYDRFGLLTDKTLLAHCIHPSKAERALIGKRGCAVVHCPPSNLFLHSGRFPLELWRDYPKLCLGTDVGAGPSFSMLDCMRDAYLVNREKPERLFYLATMGGAAALGMEDRIGSLDPGKQADFSVVTVGESEMNDGRELLSDLIFKWDQVRFRRVFVGGREVWRA